MVSMNEINIKISFKLRKYHCYRTLRIKIDNEKSGMKKKIVSIHFEYSNNSR